MIYCMWHQNTGNKRKNRKSKTQFSSISQSCLTATPWTAACQASVFINNSWSLLKVMSIELMMPFIQMLCLYVLGQKAVLLQPESQWWHDLRNEALSVAFLSPQRVSTLATSLLCQGPQLLASTGASKTIWLSLSWPEERQEGATALAGDPS